MSAKPLASSRQQPNMNDDGRGRPTRDPGPFRHDGAGRTQEHGARNGRSAGCSSPRPPLSHPSQGSAGHAGSCFSTMENSGVRARLFLASPCRLPEGERTQDQGRILASQVRPERRQRPSRRGVSPRCRLAGRDIVGMRNAEGRASSFKVGGNIHPPTRTERRPAGVCCGSERRRLEHSKNIFPIGLAVCVRRDVVGESRHVTKA